MSTYVDASAFLKLYFEEPESPACRELLRSDPDWVTARHTLVEVRRALSRGLKGRELAEAQREFVRNWNRTMIVELTEDVCESAAQIAEASGLRTLDALHLGAAQHIGSGRVTLLTYDVRQAQAARGLGWSVLGT